MRTKYEILLKLLFPKYSQPSQSRFVNSFSYLNNKKKSNKSQSSFSISFEKIEKGEDKRTSIIIKNLPNSINKEYMAKVIMIRNTFGGCKYLQKALKYIRDERAIAGGAFGVDLFRLILAFTLVDLLPPVIQSLDSG